MSVRIPAQYDFHRAVTAPHGARVRHLADRIGAAFGVSPHDRRALHIAAALHDVGKLGIPARILRKPEPLTASERTLVSMHPEMGYHILKDGEFPWPVAEIVRQHHERLDGSGYPWALEGEDISFLSRVVAVADTVDAIVSPRGYDPARSYDDAVSELRRGAGRLYDAEVTNACIGILRAEPDEGKGAA